MKPSVNYKANLQKSRYAAQRFRNEMSWFESKMEIQRVGIMEYLSKPGYKLNL